MKKATSCLLYVLFALILLYPAGTLIAGCFGYNFKLISVPTFAIATAILSIGTVVSDHIFKNTPQNRATPILLAIITPLSLINVAFYIFTLLQFWVPIILWIPVVCCFYLTVKHRDSQKREAPILIAFILSVLIALPVGFFSFIALIFGNIGQNTIVQTVESPTGEYYAQVIDSDQGALGGDTLVDVYKKSGIDAIIFKIEKKPQRIYWGNWGEFENMKVYWKDDNCLVINSNEYVIK